ncbi:MAG TPA: ankyrin repeat domain-containing protein, partial [Chitinophagaceae bacterium]|nr:ankyrin repeat domain-containing protein [Chitinophagaceae bacterium]
MLQPVEMKLDLPMKVANNVVSTTTKVWDILTASYKGDLPVVKGLVSDCPELIYAQYNYTPPIHFAVREGHVDLVKYLLDNGAHDPEYKTYPFLDSLLTVARDRKHHEIAQLLEAYCKDPSACKFKGDNGEILYNRSELELEFQKAINKTNIRRVEEILEDHPEYALDDTFFWGEGVLLFPAKGNHRELMELLMRYGAKVPKLLKWAPAYYFERYDSAVFLMEHGM